MKTISLYEEKHSLLNKMHPRTKGCYCVLAILGPVLLGDWRYNGIFILLSIILLQSAKVLKKAATMLLFSSLLFVSMLFIQGAFRSDNITPLYEIGPLTFYKEGTMIALRNICNIVNIILCVCTLILTTKPTDIVESLMRKGLSPKLGYVVLSVFTLVPQMTERMNTILDAQRSRGLETEGNLLVRIRSFLPLLTPIIMNSFVDVKERSIALESRGFNAKNARTFLGEITEYSWDKWLFLIQLYILVGLLIGRIYLWVI